MKSSEGGLPRVYRGPQHALPFARVDVILTAKSPAGRALVRRLEKPRRGVRLYDGWKSPAGACAGSPGRQPWVIERYALRVPSGTARTEERAGCPTLFLSRATPTWVAHPSCFFEGWEKMKLGVELQIGRLGPFRPLCQRGMRARNLAPQGRMTIARRFSRGTCTHLPSRVL
jgi:hypothetical protein